MKNPHPKIIPIVIQIIGHLVDLAVKLKNSKINLRKKTWDLARVFPHLCRKIKIKIEFSTYFFLLGMPTYDLPEDLKIGDT